MKMNTLRVVSYDLVICTTMNSYQAVDELARILIIYIILWQLVTSMRKVFQSRICRT